jgi:hypothetical protein
VVADAVGAVGGHAEVRVEPVEGLLGSPLGRWMDVVVDPVAVVLLVGGVGVAGSFLSGGGWCGLGLAAARAHPANND